MPQRSNKKKSRPIRPVRVRGKRLDEVDTTKIALAMWLMAQRFAQEEDATVTALPEDKSDEPDKEAA